MYGSCCTSRSVVSPSSKNPNRETVVEWTNEDTRRVYAVHACIKSWKRKPLVWGVQLACTYDKCMYGGDSNVSSNACTYVETNRGKSKSETKHAATMSREIRRGVIVREKILYEDRRRNKKESEDKTPDEGVKGK